MNRKVPFVFVSKINSCDGLPTERTLQSDMASCGDVRPHLRHTINTAAAKAMTAAQSHHSSCTTFSLEGIEAYGTFFGHLLLHHLLYLLDPAFFISICFHHFTGVRLNRVFWIGPAAWRTIMTTPIRVLLPPVRHAAVPSSRQRRSRYKERQLPPAATGEAITLHQLSLFCLVVLHYRRWNTILRLPRALVHWKRSPLDQVLHGFFGFFGFLFF
mmetsp:Transcript_20729/g.28194  ORF Transcript_20729/g.28194 Transcript_20729/m.28194 type:complete len:214 (-) Transcript_20729:256-897(-)